MRLIKRIAAALLVVGVQGAHADAADKLEGLVGYNIAAVMTVTGWQDANGKKGDSFEGCEHGRVIIFDDSKVLTCATYSYSYSYRPKAVIFVRGSSFKMLVGSNLYDMRR
jgi:hypothetical protein